MGALYTHCPFFGCKSDQFFSKHSKQHSFRKNGPLWSIDVIIFCFLFFYFKFRAINHRKKKSRINVLLLFLSTTLHVSHFERLLIIQLVKSPTGSLFLSIHSNWIISLRKKEEPYPQWITSPRTNRILICVALISFAQWRFTLNRTIKRTRSI